MLGSLCYHWATPKTHPTLIVAWYVPGPQDILSVRTYCSRGGGRVKHAHKCVYMHTHPQHIHIPIHTAHIHVHAHTTTYVHICRYMCTHMHIHMHILAYMHTKDTETDMCMNI